MTRLGHHRSTNKEKLSFRGKVAIALLVFLVASAFAARRQYSSILPPLLLFQVNVTVITDSAGVHAEARASSQLRVQSLLLPDKKQDINKQQIFYPSPIPANAQLGIRPLYGAHRQSVRHVVMTFALSYDMPQLILFLNSLLQTGFDGDIVVALSADKLVGETKTWIEHHVQHSHLIVYTPDVYGMHHGRTRARLYSAKQPGNDPASVSRNNLPSITAMLLDDKRPRRRVAQVRYEYFWAWTSRYARETQIFITDSRDVYFQRNPFAHTTVQTEGMLSPTSLQVFEEASLITNSPANANWIRKQYGKLISTSAPGVLKQPVICSGTTLGGQVAMDTYLKAMIYQHDKCRRQLLGGDQGHANWLVHAKLLVGANDGNITRVHSFAPGQGSVNTVGLIAKKHGSLLQAGVWSETKQLILDANGEPSAVVHMFDRDPMMKNLTQQWISAMILEWKNNKSAVLAPTTSY